MSKACAAGLSKGRATPSVASPERGLEEDERAEGSEPERERIRNGRRATRGERETEID
jgi:hypothetical protein